jgi:hypothetical protein
VAARGTHRLVSSPLASKLMVRTAERGASDARIPPTEHGEKAHFLGLSWETWTPKPVIFSTSNCDCYRFNKLLLRG